MFTYTHAESNKRALVLEYFLLPSPVTSSLSIVSDAVAEVFCVDWNRHGCDSNLEKQELETAIAASLRPFRLYKV